MLQSSRLCSIVALFCLVSSPAAAQEYFGEFLDRLRGTLIPDAKPRPKFQVETGFRFRDPNGLEWTVPAGAVVDGASIPQALWSVIGGPFEGAYISASVIHDHYCTTRERTAHDTHRNFYYGMRAAQVPKWKAELMHWAVATFGPSWTVTKRVVIKQTCGPTNNDRQAVCTSTPTVEMALTSLPAVDLSDPVVLAAAISKTNAVARTLLTSNGEVLDVTTAGQVAASFESVQASAKTYRQVFISKDFTRSPAALGLLSQATATSPGDVKPWANSRVPRLQDAVVLTPQTVRAVDASAPFKLDARSKDLIGGRLDLKSLETTVRLPNRTQ